jgi:flagellar operon protein
MKNVGLGNLGSVAGALDTGRPTAPQNKADAALFKEALSNAKSDVRAATIGAQAPSALKFSNHAIDRMQSRGIRFSPEDMGKIESAAAKAQAKGAKECLLISDQAALIVSLKDKTVVTVMDKANLKENVFTNIDATVMI